MARTIAENTLSLLERGTTELYRLNEQSLKILTRELRSCADLKSAIASLVDLAHFLATDLSCPRAAEALLEVAAKVVPTVEHEIPRALDVIRQKGIRFAEFSGRCTNRPAVHRSMTTPTQKASTMISNATVIHRG